MVPGWRWHTLPRVWDATGPHDKMMKQEDVEILLNRYCLREAIHLSNQSEHVICRVELVILFNHCLMIVVK